jgi:hypothetical protein
MGARLGDIGVHSRLLRVLGEAAGGGGSALTAPRSGLGPVVQSPLLLFVASQGVDQEAETAGETSCGMGPWLGPQYGVSET